MWRGLPGDTTAPEKERWDVRDRIWPGVLPHTAAARFLSGKLDTSLKAKLFQEVFVLGADSSELHKLRSLYCHLGGNHIPTSAPHSHNNGLHARFWRCYAYICTVQLKMSCFLSSFSSSFTFQFSLFLLLHLLLPQNCRPIPPPSPPNSESTPLNRHMIKRFVHRRGQ